MPTICHVPFTSGSATVKLWPMAIVAAYFPARRATKVRAMKVDPVVALRYE
jgi:ABC-type lipoprotein release transport system permease subunit